MSSGLSPSELRRFEQKVAHLANTHAPSWPGSTLARSSPSKLGSPTSKTIQSSSAESKQLASTVQSQLDMREQPTLQKDAVSADATAASPSKSSPLSAQQTLRGQPQSEPQKQDPVPRPTRATVLSNVSLSPPAAAPSVSASPCTPSSMPSAAPVSASSSREAPARSPGSWTQGATKSVIGQVQQPGSRKKLEPRKLAYVELPAPAEGTPSSPQLLIKTPTKHTHSMARPTSAAGLYPHSALSPVLGPEHARLPLYHPSHRPVGSSPSPLTGTVPQHRPEQHEGFTASMTLMDSTGRVRLELVPFSESVNSGVVSPAPPPRRAGAAAAYTPRAQSQPLSSPNTSGHQTLASPVMMQMPPHKSSPLPVPALSLFVTAVAGSQLAQGSQEGAGVRAAPRLQQQGVQAPQQVEGKSERSQAAAPLESILAANDRPASHPSRALALLHHPTAALSDVHGHQSTLDIQMQAEMQAVLARAGRAESHVYD